MIMEFQDQYQYTKNINIKLALNFENRYGWEAIVYAIPLYSTPKFTHCSESNDEALDT